MQIGLDLASTVERETRQWMLWAVAVLRATQLLPWAAVAIFSQWMPLYQRPWLVLGLYVGYSAWAALMFRVAIKRRDMSRTYAAADAVVVCLCMLGIGLVSNGGASTNWTNWTIGPAMGAAIVATVFGGWRFGAVVGTCLIVSYTASVLPELGTGTAISSPLGDVGSGVAFTIGAGLFAKRLMQSAVQADNATREAIRAREAAARTYELAHRNDLLRTNVLTTLTLVARGPDRLSSALRQRCERDAKYVRGILRQVPAIEDSQDAINATDEPICTADGKVQHGIDPKR